jgi:hypothetical protein
LKNHFPKPLFEKYHHYTRVLAFLAEQKIATAKQIEKYCFVNGSRALTCAVIKKLLNAKLITAKPIRQAGVRAYSGFSLTPEGLKDLKSIAQFELDKVQIKSNTPEHDLVLTDLRIFFSRIVQCHHFIPENIVCTKILENDLQSLANFRAQRADASVLMSVNNQKVWLAVEYERSEKARSRYIGRIRSWYENETFPGILLFAENRNLIKKLAAIDSVTLPHLQRKILYFSMDELKAVTTEMKFHNCNGNSLTFSVGNNPKIQYPILDQSFATAE